MSFEQERGKKVLAILAVVIIVVIIGQLASVISYNQNIHTTKGAQEADGSFFEIGDREDSTSSWVKRDFDLYGETADLKAQTVDGTFHNNNTRQVSSWTLTINIKEDCFINNAWCGTVEIHQFTGTEKEAVQTLDLRNYNIEDITLEYLSDGDLLIPLSKGDYLVYYPSVKDGEIPIRSNSELTMGMIFYYLDELDISDYQTEFYYHKDFTEGIGFYALIVLAVVWIVLFIILKVISASYKKAWKEMELRKSGISYMSDIYNIIYIVDLEDDELVPVVTDEESEKARPKDMGAREQLLNLFRTDPTEPYRDIMLEFADISTIAERLKKESLAKNYISKDYGWCQVRFFAMERSDGEPLKKVIFTIQVINEEKLETEEIEERISNTENETRARKIYLDLSYYDVSPLLNDIIGQAETISRESMEEKTAESAAQIKDDAESLLRTAEKISDASRIDAGIMGLDTEEYFFNDIIEKASEPVKKLTEEKNIAFKVNTAKDIPDKLAGDKKKITRILTELLLSACERTEAGTIELSVFSKVNDDKVHLLVSIKDTGTPVSEELRKNIFDETYIDDPDEYDIKKNEMRLINDLKFINNLLKVMGSELNIVLQPDGGSELYFEIDQTRGA